MPAKTLGPSLEAGPDTLRIRGPDGSRRSGSMPAFAQVFSSIFDLGNRRYPGKGRRSNGRSTVTDGSYVPGACRPSLVDSGVEDWCHRLEFRPCRRPGHKATVEGKRCKAREEEKDN